LVGSKCRRYINFGGFDLSQGIIFYGELKLDCKGKKGDKKMAEKKEITCFVCHKTEHEGVLLPCRKNGQDLWVCTRCLPMLIHGG
jgi:hypothetical protein